MINIDDLRRYAKAIEESGERFYRAAADKVANSDLKELFGYLAEQELAHAALFATFFDAGDQVIIHENMAGEYDQIFSYYSENMIFTEQRLRELMGSLFSPADLIDFALHREMDTIAFYRELKETLAEKYHTKLDRLIAEERSHFADLLKVKKTL